MKYKKLDHAVIRVRDIVQASKDYEKLLGIAPEHVVKEQENQGYLSTLFRLGESGNILLLAQGIDETKQAGRAFIQGLEKFGEGFHNLAIAVDNVEEAMQGCIARGSSIIPSKHTNSFFLHPKDTHGVLIQIMKR